MLVDLAHEADFALGHMLVRPSRRCVVLGGAEQQVEPRVMQVLVVLARGAEKVISRDDLVEQCWDGRIVGDDAINRAVSLLRKLAETSGAFSVETVTRIGYRLVLKDGPAPAVAAAPPGEAKAGPQAASRRKPLFLRPAWLIAAGAVLVAAAATVLAPTLMGGARAGSQAKQQRIAFFGVSAPAGNAAAVSLAEQAANDVFGTIRVMQLDMVARGETEGVAARERLDRATKLGALYAVSGTVIRKEGNLSLSLQLDDVPTRTVLWIEPLEAAQADAPRLSVRSAALFTDVTSCVVSVRATLDRDDIAIVSKLPAACRDMRMPNGNIGKWRDLIALAPNSAFLNAAAALSIRNTVRTATPVAAEELKAEAIARAARAEELDPNNPETQIARIASAELQGKTLFEREPLYLEGLKRAPEGRNIHGWYAGFLSRVGRAKEARSYGAKALTLDPLSAPKLLGLARVLSRAGDLPEAQAIFAQVHARWPSTGAWHSRLSLTATTRSADIDALLNDPPPDATPEIIACTRDIFPAVQSTNAAVRTKANARVDECLRAGRLQLYDAVHLHALFGDLDAAFRLTAIEGAYDAFDAAFYEPSIPAFRADPRFKPLMEKFGLLAYWRDSGHAPDFCATEKAPVCDAIKAPTGQ